MLSIFEKDFMSLKEYGFAKTVKITVLVCEILLSHANSFFENLCDFQGLLFDLCNPTTTLL